MCLIQYRSKLSWQSVASLDSRLDSRFSIPCSCQSFEMVPFHVMTSWRGMVKRFDVWIFVVLHTGIQRFTQDVCWNTRNVELKSFFFPEMRLYFFIFITAVCFTFLLLKTKMAKKQKCLRSSFQKSQFQSELIYFFKFVHPSFLLYMSPCVWLLYLLWMFWAVIFIFLAI